MLSSTVTVSRSLRTPVTWSHPEKAADLIPGAIRAVLA